MSSQEIPYNKRVRGYMKPDASFYTLSEWEAIVNKLLRFQTLGIDSRSGKLSCKDIQQCSKEEFKNFLSIVNKYFGYQLGVEVDRWDLLTEKNILDFIEDFVNHRFWGMEKEFGSYFPDISKLRFSYFYSRGDMEPYVVLDDAFTRQLYGSTYNPKVVQHYTSPEGLQGLEESISSGNTFDISAFTVANRPFFRSESNIIVYLLANVKAGFRSDIKSMAIDTGRRAANLYRLNHPGEESNICHDLRLCDGQLKTSLWNEYIVEPIEIIKAEAVPTNENKIRSYIRYILG